MISIASFIDWLRQPASKGMGGRSRLEVACRAVIALFGGYLLVGLWASSLSVALPIDRHNAVFIASLTAFLLFPLIVIWAFYCRDVMRLLASVIIIALVFVVILWMGSTALMLENSL